ncbi:hypothetical protein RHOSPDRAFT_36119 [Rhodotorula sp. JG-1b]|nr:hypothetical protein RHOSPDRAFT_36119 [Rhodotorula sp. JG-1b]
MAGVAPPSTPRTTNTTDAESSRHHPSRQSHGLAGEEVLELTTFAEKKAWIDEKIQFLSTLPEIRASEPEPPASPAATSAELEAWWEEHRRIEREIDEYDMGDLARMRQLARDKSKHALSPRDTDLIEITLTTLFSVDKLLHLLRHRRRALTLLRHRLLWEETTETAWERYRAIIESDLPAFLRHAQAASGPPPPSDPLRNSQRSSSISASTSSTDLGASLRSLSASTSSRDLASSAGSFSTNRAQLSQLAYTTLTTNARTLSASLVPAAAASLDKLIDASPTPLPVSFLDAQDRLEEVVSALLGDGLDRFAAEVIRQSEMVVIMRTDIDRIQQESTTLAAEAVSEASTPTRETLAELLGRLERIQTRVDDVQDQLRDLPRPRHSAVPNQSEHTASLVAEIETRLSSCRKSLAETSAVVHIYRQRLDVSTELEALLLEMRESSDRLEKLFAESGSLNGRPSCDLQLPDNDSRQVSSTRRLFAEHAAACESRTSSLSTDVLQAQDLCKRAARLVNAARDVNLDISIRQDLRRASNSLREKVAEASRILEWETAHRERVVELSAWLLSLERCQALLAEAESSTREQLQLALWREGTAAVIDDDDGGAAAPVMASIDTALADLSAKRQLVAEQSRAAPCAGPAALASLQERMDGLDERVRFLRTRQSLIDRAHEQTRAIEAVVESLSSIRARTFSVVSRVQCDSNLASSDEDEIDRIAQDFDHLRQNLHARVPFLAAGPSSASSEVDLTSHDANIRSVLNEMCISTAGLIDSSRQSVVNATKELSRLEVHSTGSDKAQEVAPEVVAVGVPADHDAGLEEVALPVAPPPEPPVRPESDSRVHLDLSVTPTTEAKSPSVSDNAAPKVADDLFSPEIGLEYSAAKHRIDDDWLAPLEEPATVRSLRQRIRAIPTLTWLSPSILRLPREADVEEIVAETAGCTTTLDELLAESSSDNIPSLRALRDELAALEPATTRVQKLAAFAECTSQTDTAFSGLLDHIDAADLQADRTDERPEALSAAADAMTALHRAAIECADDPRVQRTLQRVESTYNELLDLLPPKTYPPIPAGHRTLPHAADDTKSTDGGNTRTSLREMERQGLKSPESSRSSSRASTARSSLSRSTALRSGATTPTTTPWRRSYGSSSTRNSIIDVGIDVASVDSPSSGTGFCVNRDPTAQQGQRICLAGSSVDAVAVEADGEADIWYHTARCYSSARPQSGEKR